MLTFIINVNVHFSLRQNIFSITGLGNMGYGNVTPIYIQKMISFTGLVLIIIEEIGFMLMFQGKLVLLICYNCSIFGGILM